MNEKEIRERMARYRFYHVLKLRDGLFTPGWTATIPGINVVLDVLHRLDFRGKRVLDIGCRDGLFSFEAEKMGASEVVGIDNDLSPAATEFLVPFFGSNVKLHELNVYDLTPETFGKFDVVIFPGVLYHLRYPFWGLKRVRDVLKDDGTLVLETAVLDDDNKYPLLYCPHTSPLPTDITSCTFFNVQGLKETLISLGMSVESVNYLYPQGYQKQEWMSSQAVPHHDYKTTSGFLSLVYLHLFARPLDASGLSYWGKQLDDGLSRESVVEAILGSDEYKMKSQGAKHIAGQVVRVLQDASLQRTLEQREQQWRSQERPLPTNRATLCCQMALHTINPVIDGYWHGTHKIHTAHSGALAG